MVNENRSNVLAAAAGIVVGAGAAIAGAVTLANKKNQKKVIDFSREVRSRLDGAKKDIDTTKNEVSDKLITSKATVKKVATKSIDSAIKVAKVAKKEVRKI